MKTDNKEADSRLKLATEKNTKETSSELNGKWEHLERRKLILLRGDINTGSCKIDHTF